MKQLPRSLQSILDLISQPLVSIFIATLLVYGSFVPFLGFYWDDLMIQWISQTMGSNGLATYFSTNRPVWGLFYQLSTSILGEEPWQWQLFAIFWRWLAAVGIYSLCKQLWKQQTPAWLAALVFITYPGFSQQYISTVYGHFFLVLSAFFFSITLSLKAIETNNRKQFWVFTLSALVLSAINLLSMEYFFMLELLRPLFFWMVKTEKEIAFRDQIKPLLKYWFIYLLLFLVAGFWRAFLFEYQTNNYEAGLVDLLRTNPIQAILTLLGLVLKDIWQTLIGVWQLVVQFPGAEFGQRAWLIMIFFSLALFVFALVVYWITQKKNCDSDKQEFKHSLLISLVALLLAGFPFWLTFIPIGLAFPNDRFTLPFVLGVALFWVSLINLVPIRKWMQVGILLVAVTLATAYQLRTGIQFQRDWEQQSRFFWQMTWRIPSLEENTIVFSHELPLQYFSDNSLTGGLNWIYAEPDRQDNSIPYVLYYPTIRVGLAVRALNPDEPVVQNLLVGTFYGNTSQSIGIFYEPPACFRVLDPEIEADNWMVPLQVRETIHLTNWDVIKESPLHIPPPFYSAEPAHQWCYYFQKADLARQLGKWEEVVELGEVAFSLEDQPNDPVERFPFIEGYAHQNQWKQALSFSEQSAAITPVIHPALCRLWDRIERETPDSEVKRNAIQKAVGSLTCENQP
jgi:uncharacterized Tic20 family protein